MLSLATVLGLILMLASTTAKMGTHCEPVASLGCLISFLLGHDASYDSIVSQALDGYMILLWPGSMTQCCSMMSGSTFIVIPLYEHKLKPFVLSLLCHNLSPHVGVLDV